MCGYPTRNGDLYGGAHYLEAASSTMTPQGRAIHQAAVKFGDGRTLPFTPCKKGYIPVVQGVQMVACPLHNKQRQRRLAKEKGKLRSGEADPNELFWCKESSKYSTWGDVHGVAAVSNNIEKGA